MRTIAAVFPNRHGARRAADRIRATLQRVAARALTERDLRPGAGRVPETEDMSPVGGKMAAVLIGALMGTTTFLVLDGMDGFPVSVVGALVVGVLAGMAGRWVGGRIDRASSTGIPSDELAVYRDAARAGRGVVVAFVSDPDQESEVRQVFRELGAEAVDPASRLVGGHRGDGEEGVYVPDAPDAAAEQTCFRRGYEAGLLSDFRGHPFEVLRPQLERLAPDCHEHPSFRKGFVEAQGRRTPAEHEETA